MAHTQKLRRALIASLIVTAALLTLAALALRVPEVGELVRALPFSPAIGPIPPPPAIAAPAGPLPSGPAGVGELAQFGAQDFRAVGCGFFLRLPDDTVIAVTTAHSVPGLGQRARAGDTCDTRADDCNLASSRGRFGGDRVFCHGVFLCWQQIVFEGVGVNVL